MTRRIYGLRILMKRGEQVKTGAARSKVMKKLLFQMKILFLEKFNKDLDKIKEVSMKKKIVRVIREIESSPYPSHYFKHKEDQRRYNFL